MVNQPWPLPIVPSPPPNAFPRIHPKCGTRPFVRHPSRFGAPPPAPPRTALLDPAAGHRPPATYQYSNLAWVDTFQLSTRNNHPAHAEAMWVSNLRQIHQRHSLPLWIPNTSGALASLSSFVPARNALEVSHWYVSIGHKTH